MNGRVYSSAACARVHYGNHRSLLALEVASAGAGRAGELSRAVLHRRRLCSRRFCVILLCAGFVRCGLPCPI